VSTSAEYLDFIKDQMADFGPVSVRRMFGGAGIYRDGVIFALVVGEDLFLKADDRTRGDFEAEGLGPFTYATKNGPNTITSYWRAPSRCLDDRDEMTLWCRKAYEAALASEQSKPSKRR